MSTEEVEYDRTTVYVNDRDKLRSRIHELRSKFETVGDAEMREIYPAMFEVASEHGGEVAEKIRENRGESR